MRPLIGAAGAGDHCAPASPFRPPRQRPMASVERSAARRLGRPLTSPLGIAPLPWRYSDAHT